MKTFRSWHVLGLVLLSGVVIGLFSAGCSRQEPYKIGFVATLTGSTVDLGVSGRNGAMLAIEEANAAGGIKGRAVELWVRDLKSDMESAQLVTRGLINSNVELIIGPMTSGRAMALVPIINASNSILLSPTVTTTYLTGKDDNFLRVIDDTRTYARQSARYQYQVLGHHSFSAIYDISNNAYSESWLRDFREEFERLGGKTQDIHNYIPTVGTSYSAIAARALQRKPAVILVIGSSVDAAVICQQLRKADPAQAIVLSEWPATERFIELAGDAAERIVTAQFIQRDDPANRYQTFKKAYQARFGAKPGFAGLTGYDAGLVALRALAEQKSGEPLKKTILRIGKFDGAQSKIEIDAFGDAKRNTYITVVRDGRFVQVEHAP